MKKSTQKPTAKKKTMWKMWLKLITFVIVFSSFQLAQAGKIDLMIGAFSINAKTSTTSGGKSNLGAYHLKYSIPVFKQAELFMGYTLIMSTIVGGDLSFGFDLGINYFPMTLASQTKAVTPKAFLKINPLWRPYTSVGFAQREFQSVRSNYAGFSVGGGFERALTQSFDMKGELRYTSLGGPGAANATEIVILGGITFP